VSPCISVVIPSYRAAATLPRVLAALEPQIAGREREVVVVDSSSDGSTDILASRFPWARFVALGERTLPGRARNLGAGLTQCELLAFLDADVIPSPGCLDALEQRLVPGVDLAVAAVCNGTPRSPTGTAGYLLEFLDFSPSGRVQPRHAVSCAMLVRRTAYERVGGFPEDLWPGEDTVFSLRLSEVHPLVFEQSARVTHLNRRGLLPFLAHQRTLGASFVAAAGRARLPGRRFATRPFVFVAGPARAASLVARLWRHPHQAPTAILVSPWLMLGLAAWSVGALSGRD
jgi:mycofactocin glycosyltransferase